MLELLAKDHFNDSLTDEDMKLRIRQNRPESLQQVLEAALELESYWLASRQCAIPVRSAQLDCKSDCTQSRPQTRTRPSEESRCAGGVAAVYKQDAPIVSRVHEVTGTEKAYQEKLPAIFLITETVHLLELW